MVRVEIIAHRGLWIDRREANGREALCRALERGFGVETDVRDLGGALVISHDPPAAGALPLEEFFEAYAGYSRGLPLALNVKSDGLQGLIAGALAAFRISDYFLFDMAVPDALVCLRKGLRVFARQSEVEERPSFYAEAAGVWLDAFFGEWYSRDLVGGHLDEAKDVCVVSPELHGRAHMPVWKMLRDLGAREGRRLMICTDFPEEARKYFGQ